MMKTLTLVVGIMMTQIAWAQLPDFTLGLHDGGPAFDQGNGLTSDNTGNLITTGTFVDSATIGDSAFTSFGGPDGFLAKYDRDGTFLWARQLGSTGSVLPNGVTTDESDNIIVTGSFRETIDLGDTTLTSVGDFDVFLAKYDKDGTLLWASRMGGIAGGDEALEVAADNMGDIALTGYYFLSASFGDTTLTSVALSEDIFVAKYTGSGQFLWAASAGGPGFVDEGHGVAIHSDGSVHISGRFNGPEATFGDTTVTGKGGFIAKYDSGGRFIWVRPAVNTGIRCTITDVEIGDDGDVYGVGYFPDTLVIGGSTLVSNGGNDTFVLRLNEDGTLLYVDQIAGSDPVFGLTLSLDESSSYFTVAGYFSGTIEIGDTTLSVSKSQIEGFVAAYSLGGFPSWA
ncbi:MAG: SBBP repeat-containing protein, partial [Bacteroidetes bacterium]|nr:SBBP repeat-containing protein [Bacteroidota bacterium]